MTITIVSGGQTGVDRAALDAAQDLGLACGGFCPRGRAAEDGRIDDRYPLIETPSADYAERTEWNIVHSDATLILHRGRLSGGTALTAHLARKHGKPLRLVDLAQHPDSGPVADWTRGFRTLNVAGPRESQSPGIYQAARDFLQPVLAERLKAAPGVRSRP